MSLNCATCFGIDIQHSDETHPYKNAPSYPIAIYRSFQSPSGVANQSKLWWAKWSVCRLTRLVSISSLGICGVRGF